MFKGSIVQLFNCSIVQLFEGFQRFLVVLSVLSAFVVKKV